MGFESVHKPKVEEGSENINNIDTKECPETVVNDDEKIHTGFLEKESNVDVIIDSNIFDEKTPKEKVGSEAESKLEFQFTHIDDDPRFKEIQEEMSDRAVKDELDLIKKRKPGMSDFEAESELRYSSGILNIDGKYRQSFYPIAFHREFEKRYPEDYAKYQESEKERIYDTWFDDPAVTRLTNSISDLRNRYMSWDGGREYQAYTSHENVTKHHNEQADTYRKFAQDFPKKAAVYRKFYKELDNLMNRDEVSQRADEDRKKFYIDMDKQIKLHETSLEPTYKNEPLGQLENSTEQNSITSSPEKIDTSSLPENQETNFPIEADESSEEDTEEDRAKYINEAFKSNELIRSHILENDLAYQDAELPEETKSAMLEWSKGSSSASKYAESLEKMAGRESLEQLRQRADIIKGKMLTIAEKIGLPISGHGKSRSWAMWDLGKQFHYFLHPEQSGAKYDIANPLSSEKKQQEIVDRHLGWEAYAAFNSPKSLEWKNEISTDPRFAKALELLNKRPKNNKTLSSSDLRALGALLRSA